MRPYMYNTHPNFELLFAKKTKKKQNKTKVLSRKQRKWSCKTGEKSSLLLFWNTWEKKTWSSLQKCHSIQQQLIQKTICSSDGFFWAASSCKIMNSVCNLLETSRPLFNERSRGWRTEVNPFTTELFSFTDATFKFSVTWGSNAP